MVQSDDECLCNVDFDCCCFVEVSPVVVVVARDEDAAVLNTRCRGIMAWRSLPRLRKDGKLVECQMRICLVQ